MLMKYVIKNEEKSRHHDDEQCHSTLPAAKLFFPLQLKVESMYHNKKEVPPNG